MNRARTLAHILVVTGAAASGCGLNQAGVSPPADTFFYPSSAVTDQAGRWLFVANSNADLRYNDGTVVTVDLTAAANDWLARGAMLDNDFASWEPCPAADYVNTPRPTSDPAHFCCWDRLDPNILNCDERAYIDPNASVRIGSFAAGMVIQNAIPAHDPAGTACSNTVAEGHRMFVAVRGDTSVTWMDVDQTATPPHLDCGDSGTGTQSSLPACDDLHRLTQAPVRLAATSMDPMPPAVQLPNEPYGLAIDDYYGLLYVGHLTGDTGHPYTGGFSLFDVAPDGDGLPAQPEFIAPFPSPFSGNSAGLVGITNMTVVRRSDAMGNASPPQIFASSRYTPQVSSLGAAATCGETQAPAQRFRDVAAFPNGITYNTGISGAETRGIEFVNGQPFVLQRVPPALVSFNGPTPASMIETCSGPTYLYQYTPAGQHPRLLVNCYDVGEVDVFDTVAPHLIGAVPVGRGPAGLVLPEHDQPSPVFGRPVAYVVGFGDNNISVVDLAPGSPTELHVIQRIGFPSTVPR